MVTATTLREIALSFEATEEQPHFEITSFRVKKKIFVTLNLNLQHITIRLSAADQAMFCEYNPAVVYPVNSAWGKHGWTHVSLERVDEELLRALITLSYCQVAPKKLAEKYQQDLG
jgi:predicted DNA-binding protein (MmcQ/YjbR family)